MKLRKIVMLLAILEGMALQGLAQKVDLNSLRLVEITTDGVNMRKAPSTNSPKLMAQRLTGGEGCESIAITVWSDSKKTLGFTRESKALHKGNVLPIEAEVGDWYKALYWDAAGTFEVYVSKQFCREVRRQHITNPYGTAITSGPYKGWYVMDNSDLENDEEYILGHLINGFMVYEMSCTENCSDVYRLIEAKKFSQLGQFFTKREKKLVNFQTDQQDRYYAFEIDNN